MKIILNHFFNIVNKGDFMQVPKLSLEEDKWASNEIVMYYKCSGQETEHGKLIDYFFSNIIKEVLDNSFDLDEFLSSKTEDEQIIIKKLLQITLEKLNGENESGYFGVKKTYDFDGDNWHYIDEIKLAFGSIDFFHAETLDGLKKEVAKNNCLWLITDETSASKSRIRDAKLRREKENAYDEESYDESLEIHPRYAVRLIREYYGSSSKFDDLIETIFTKDCLNAIYNNTLDINLFLDSKNPMERAIVKLLIPFINNKLHFDVELNDTGIFGVKTAYDENGNNWIYDDELRSYFDYPKRIYAKTLEELKEKVIENKGIWFVLDENLEKRSLIRDNEIQIENSLIKNSPSQSRIIIKNFIGKWFSTGTADSYSDLIKMIHSSNVMKSIIDKSLNVEWMIGSYDIIGKMIIRMSIQKMKDALSFARMNNYTTGYFGVIHPKYNSWSYVNLVKREYLGLDDCDVIHASSLKELEEKVKSSGNVWCIFDEEKAEKVHEMDRILINSYNSGSIASIEDYWDSLTSYPLRKEITAEYIDGLIEKNRKRENYLRMKEEEKMRWEKIRQLERELGMDKEYEMSSDIKKILRKIE